AMRAMRPLAMRTPAKPSHRREAVHPQVYAEQYRASEDLDTPSRSSGSARPRTNDQLYFAADHVEQANHLAQSLPRVGSIEQPVDLRDGRAEAACELSPAESGVFDSPACLDRQLVYQQLAQIGRVFVVLEGRIDVQGPFVAGRQYIGDPFPA